MSKLSVVLPAYNEELMVGKTCRVLAEVLTEAKIPYELVVVNDGSVPAVVLSAFFQKRQTKKGRNGAGYFRAGGHADR